MAATTINIDAYGDALIVLATAGIVVPIVARWRVSPVLGYLAAGALLGPYGLGSLQTAAPFLYWVTITDAQRVAGIAELGVVFLMFLIGLELSFQRLLTMRRLVFGLGMLQVVVTAAVIAGIAALFGNGGAPSLIVGLSLALSSTAIVLEVLSRQGRLTTSTGRTSFAILLAQDLAVVPLLLLVSILGGRSGGSALAGLALALGHAALAVGLIGITGQLLLRPLFRLVASSGATELFVAATLFVVIATGVIAGVAGLSMALGAFIAGLLLAETEFRKAIEATIDPFKALLLGLFFFTVGMGIDIRELGRDPFWLLASVVGLIAIKAGCVTGLARLFRVPLPAAIETGLLMGPGGEFAFVALGLATLLGIIGTPAANFMLAVTSLTMAMIPLLAMAAHRITSRLERRRATDPELTVPPPAGLSAHAIVIGHGRVGQIVCAMLEHHHFPFIASDSDPAAVAHYRRRGRQVYYGDATHLTFLQSCGLMQAAAVIVTIHTQAAIDEIVQVVRSLRPDLLIVSRARDAAHARHLYAVGVTDAVPETIEASLQLSEAALVGLGLPTGPVIASIHEKRDEFRSELQEAAGRAGLAQTRSIRAKTMRGASS
ncbi:MAG TPA: cation:proton antiporter [Hyphomicrobiaceae bacterium]|nr:cation:proton antiporter [Hyphomicrobiaceae bacterium]